jgi:pyruvate formate lyase activating enzyme
MKECYLYTKLEKEKIRCDLCNHRCVINEDETGKCFVRKNINGKLYSLVYGKLIAENVDPIEKKPLFHFLPGTYSYSIATVGCNFKCFFCQNYQISQMPSDENYIDGKLTSPEAIVQNALKYNCKSISYTYTEPTVYFELAYDTSVLAKKNNLKNVFVTNGFMTKEALDMIAPYLDAANVDLKSFSDEFYKKYIGGRLTPVLENIKYMKKLSIWVEVTTLLIPGLNDSVDELTQIAKFLKEINKNIPWHISAYYPQYKSNIPPTSFDSIKKAVEIGKSIGLSYVYGGNVAFSDLEDTVCPNCQNILIKRKGFSILKNNVNNGSCNSCGYKIDGIF